MELHNALRIEQCTLQSQCRQVTCLAAIFAAASFDSQGRQSKAIFIFQSIMKLNVLLFAITSSLIDRSSCFRSLFSAQTLLSREEYQTRRVNCPSLWDQVNSVENAERPTGTFVESFELQNWGLFEHSVLTLGSAPLFAVITGETGSGKSVLISALQYLYSNSGSS
jgi:ABC-type multidrug transport system fused ATPase/permease subunit